MPRTCTVCQHPNYHQIDVWLIEGVSANEVARRTGLGKHAIRRHRQAGLHLRSWKAQELKDAEATVRRRVDNVVRTRSNRALKRQEQATVEYEPSPEPMPPLSPPPAKPVPVNPPDKMFTEEEMLAVLAGTHRARRRRNEPRYY